MIISWSIKIPFTLLYVNHSLNYILYIIAKRYLSMQINFLVYIFINILLHVCVYLRIDLLIEFYGIEVVYRRQNRSGK